MWRGQLSVLHLSQCTREMPLLGRASCASSCQTQNQRSWSFYLGTAVVCRPLISAWNTRSHSIKMLSPPLCSLPVADYQNLCHLSSMPLAKAWLTWVCNKLHGWCYLADSGSRNFEFCRMTCWKLLFLEIFSFFEHSSTLLCQRVDN
jgi:hypothetical protein